MSVRTSLLKWALLLVGICGCSETRRQEPRADRTVGEAEQSLAMADAVAPAVDPVYVLDQLREVVSTLGPEWSIAMSPTQWSTLTVDVGEHFASDTAAKVWAKWTEPVTALTLAANKQIKSEIEQAVADAKPGQRAVEREFNSQGFQFVVTASDGRFPVTTFVRISFMRQGP